MKLKNMKGFFSGVIVTTIVSLSFSAFADSIEKQILVSYNNIKVVISGQEVTTKDGDGNTVEPFSYNGTVYLPVRAVTQALGCSVSWDDTTSTVTITPASNSQSAGGAMSKPDSTSMKERIQTVLTTLVTNGTLTQEKADAVLTYFESAETEQTAGTQATQGTEKKKDPLSQAVSDGVITQEQADAINEQMKPQGGQMGPGGESNGDRPSGNEKTSNN